MDPQTWITIEQGVQAIAAIVVASGLIPVGLAYLKAKGIDIAAVQNNKLVQAAERAAKSVVVDCLIGGKPILDPETIANARLAVLKTLNDTHAETAAALGASAADMDRIAGNAVKGAVAIATLPLAAVSLVSTTDTVLHSSAG